MKIKIYDIDVYVVIKLVKDYSPYLNEDFKVDGVYRRDMWRPESDIVEGVFLYEEDAINAAEYIKGKYGIDCKIEDLPIDGEICFSMDPSKKKLYEQKINECGEKIYEFEI